MESDHFYFEKYLIESIITNFISNSLLSESFGNYVKHKAKTRYDEYIIPIEYILQLVSSFESTEKSLIIINILIAHYTEETSNISKYINCGNLLRAKVRGLSFALLILILNLNLEFEDLKFNSNLKIIIKKLIVKIETLSNIKEYEGLKVYVKDLFAKLLKVFKEHNLLTFNSLLKIKDFLKELKENELIEYISNNYYDIINVDNNKKYVANRSLDIKKIKKFDDYLKKYESNVNNYANIRPKVASKSNNKLPSKPGNSDNKNKSKLLPKDKIRHNFNIKPSICNQIISFKDVKDNINNLNYESNNNNNRLVLKDLDDKPKRSTTKDAKLEVNNDNNTIISDLNLDIIAKSTPNKL